MKVLVTRRRDLAPDICSVELAAPSGAALPAFSAGSHIDVQVNGLVRQYSLCNNPKETNRYLIAVLREVTSRGGSSAMHALRKGDELEISEPKNHFSLASRARHSILVAGGIGITPILCMAERLAHLEASFEIHYAAREASRLVFRTRLEAADLRARTSFYWDTGAQASRPDFEQIFRSGGVDSHVYVCGPSGFIAAVLAAAERAGYPPANVHREYFTVDAAAARSGSSDADFEVKIASNGKIVKVSADQSVSEALKEAGIDVPTSCAQGACGTCLTRVLEGIPDHRDFYLTEEERLANNQFLPCCSRSLTSRLTLDL